MKLFEQCQFVLEKNWKGTFTIPSPRLYPFQWNWDSGFIAIGNLYLNPEKAILEIETLFAGQWENGFLPHIIFHKADNYSSYFPSADYWNSFISSFSPKKLKTSGITQPPVHGFVLEYLLKHNFERDRLVKLFKQIVNYHKYLYDYREFNDSGLVAIWHNWESGMDNSVWWDDVLNTIPESELTDIKLLRKDINEVKQSYKTRPKDSDYKRYLYLVNQLRDSNYERDPKTYSFQILDPVFNSILIESNASLLRVGELLNLETSYIKSKTEQGIESFANYLWNTEDSLYYPFDLVNQKQIKKHCSGCYMPIFAGIPSSSQIDELINSIDAADNLVPVPSCYPNQSGFQKENYWRGPVWININWMLWKGLLKYKKYELADKVKNSTIKLVESFGIYEYFDPYLNTESITGYGGSDFSWTASLIIDMLRSDKA